MRIKHTVKHSTDLVGKMMEFFDGGRPGQHTIEIFDDFDRSIAVYHGPDLESLIDEAKVDFPKLTTRLFKILDNYED